MRKVGKSEQCFRAICEISKNLRDITISNRKMNFNKTELRLLSEIISAKSKGERLISTEIAKRLGITRSAVSQIVNRLEEQGVVKRIPDNVDKKIAYVEITENAMDECSEDMKGCIKFIGNVVNKFGEEKFNRMCEQIEEFADLIEKEKQIVNKQKGDKKDVRIKRD